MTFLYLLLILSGLYGFFITYRIHKEKTKGGPMVCPLGAHCDIVVHSKFSSFFGINLEIFGALYYGIIVIAYAVYLLAAAAGMAFPVWFFFILFGMSVAGFLFSIYLTFIQAFYIKSWCSWCICSACASTLIFLISLYTIILSGMTFIPLLEFLKTPLLIMHLVGFALGVGGATITDILFYRFLKDFKITKEEDSIFQVMSQVIWAGLFIAIISGLGLYLPNAEALNESVKFLVKVIVVAVVTINGAVLNLVVSPRLVDMSFKNEDEMKNSVDVKKTARFRKIAFALGAISIVSWYSAAILGAIESVSISFGELLGIYIGILIIAIIGSQIAENLFYKKANSTI